MAKVLVFLEGSGSQLKKGSLELLSVAQKSGLETDAVAYGPEASAYAAPAGSYGAKTLWTLGGDKFRDFNPELFTLGLCEAIKASGAEFVLATASMLARDVFPRVGARLDSGVASDCTELSLGSSGIRARRPLYAGKCSAEVEFVESPVKIVLMRANQLPVESAKGGAAAAVKEVAISPSDLRTSVKEVRREQSGKLDLTEANMIVSGGRGLQGPENFKLLEELAATLGGTVGASRAVADAGWVPHSMQVGQTGKTVAPTLYIACGISGAIQHLAGMSGSKVIVAINKDGEAPIFQKSTYGIVGDLFAVVPKLNEELKALLK